MNQSTRVVRRATHQGLSAAVHRSRALSKSGALERLFTFAFQRLVYPQIWEDPLVDMAALRLGPADRVVAIASGGCNVLSYLAADPARITAVDLNGAHIALNRLKLCALANLPASTRVLGRLAANRRPILRYRKIHSWGREPLIARRTILACR